MENKLADALAKAQALIKAPIKKKEVKFGNTKYFYADLQDTIDALQPHLSNNGLSYSHTLSFVGERFSLITTLRHVSGESIESQYPLPNPQGMKPQDFGAQLTYARRYSLSCITGIATDDDTDGHTSGKETTQPPLNNKTPSPSKNTKNAPSAGDSFLEQEEFQDTPLSIMREMSREMGLDAEMPNIIKRVIGIQKKSANMSEDEISKVVDYLLLLKK